MIYEIEHVDCQGNHHFQEVEGHYAARIIARRLALATAFRVIMRKAPPREWRLLIADLETGCTVESPHKFSKREALHFWREWQESSENAILVFWPEWAKASIQIDQSA